MSFKIILLYLLCITTNYALLELPITVIIPTYNNSDYCIANIVSILKQYYDNYYVIIIDDASTDDTYQKIKDFLAIHDTSHRILLLHNAQRLGALANRWHAVHAVPSHHIIIDCDGDDFFVDNPYVFQRINYEYLKGAWATWGSYIEYPEGTSGHCRALSSADITANRWRDLPLPLATSHPRTYYAGLFKNIALADLLKKGEFYPAAGDVAYFFAVLEQAGFRARYIPDFLYIYNIQTPLNDFKIRLALQLECFNEIRAKQKYKPLANDSFLHPVTPINKADIIIFSFNRPLQLYALLESIEKNIQNNNTITVLYRADSLYADAYETLKQTFPTFTFIRQSTTNPRTDFKPLTLECLRASECPYCIFAVDDIIVTRPVDVTSCINALEKTHAYGFYLRLGTNLDYCYTDPQKQPLPPMVMVDDTVIAWQFKHGIADWGYPNTVDMTLYRKKDIIQTFEQLNYTSPNTLEGQWSTISPTNGVGLCFNQSCIVNIPLNKVQQDWFNYSMNYDIKELLNVFNNGYKINIEPLQGIENKAAHCECLMQYIQR